MRRPLALLPSTLAGLVGVAAVLAGVAIAPLTARARQAGPAAAVEPSVLGVTGRTNAHATVASDGDFVVVTWAATLDKTTDVFAATSHDGGKHFGAPIRVNRVEGDVSLGAERPPHVAIGQRHGRRLVAIVWTARAADGTSGTAIRLAESTDDARTFATQRTVHSEALTGLRSWESVALGPDGSVHVSWLDGRNAKATAKAAAPASASHGAAGTHEGHASGSASHPSGGPRQDLFYASISADGRIEERLVAQSVCFCCKTATVVDARGVVSLAWRHIFPGSERDIALVQAGAGSAFSDPVRISPDRWKLQACPDDGSAMQVDAKGQLHIAWPSFIATGEGEKALFYATSSDGRRFSDRLRIDRDAGMASHPQLTVTPDGRPAIAWDEAVDGRRQVWLRIGDAKAGSFADPIPIGSTGSGTYPALAASRRSIVVVWTQRTGSLSSIGLATVPMPLTPRSSQ